MVQLETNVFFFVEYFPEDGHKRGRNMQQEYHMPDLFFLTMAQKPPQWGKASSVSRTPDHTQLDTPHSTGLLWTGDQPNAETSTWQHTTLTTDSYPCPRRDSNPQS